MNNQSQPSFTQYPSAGPTQLYGFVVSLYTQLRSMLFIHWSSPLLFDKLLIELRRPNVNIYPVTVTVTVTVTVNVTVTVTVTKGCEL